MNFIIWLVIGGLIGWLASMLMKTDGQQGIFLNVIVGVVGAMLQSLDESQRVRILRCLRQYHEEEYWRQLWQQAANSGKLLWKKGAAWLGK